MTAEKIHVDITDVCQGFNEENWIFSSLPDRIWMKSTLNLMFGEQQSVVCAMERSLGVIRVLTLIRDGRASVTNSG